ncbi:MAG: cysteine--tRNA ligase [Legionellales bacterium]|nr:cysteine--tRNA ligase [Legionellales bacterium]
MLKIYNSLTQTKEEFIPREPGKVGLYVCGITVYDYCHLGHARLLVAFDMIARYLRAVGYDVTHVCNITDIDDKIIQRANDNQEPYQTLTSRFIEALHEDAEALGVLPPDVEPRATAYISEIIAMIERLIQHGLAYQAPNNDVFYRVRAFKDYGKLSRRDLESLRAGARVEITEAKEDPLDFVLWKSAKPSEPAFGSPWGLGRPGWHIECSAMSTQCLGNHFDIHGGGFDLLFPHHENEIAQSVGATGEPFADVWMHLGFVQVNNEKMSKSLGNFFTIREVLKHYHPEVVRYFLLASHYRSQINYSTENLNHARASLNRLYTALRGLTINQPLADPSSEYYQRFFEAMNDDFNTPEALAVLFNLAHEINRAREHDLKLAHHLASILKQLAGIIGLLQTDAELFLQSDVQGEVLDTAYIETQIQLRQLARQEKNWAKADEIRDHLLAQGVILEDQSGNTVWRRQ